MTLTNVETSETASLATDDFGDFWFERQEPGRYLLRIEKEGYSPKTLDEIEVTKDVNVGDIELHAVGPR